MAWTVSIIQSGAGKGYFKARAEYRVGAEVDPAFVSERDWLVAADLNAFVALTKRAYGAWVAETARLATQQVTLNAKAAQIKTALEA